MSRVLAKLGPASGARRSNTRALSPPPNRQARTSTSQSEATELTSQQGALHARRRPSRTGPSSARSAARRESRSLTTARARTRGPPAREARGALPRRTQAGGASTLEHRDRRVRAAGCVPVPHPDGDAVELAGAESDQVEGSVREVRVARTNDGNHLPLVFGCLLCRGHCARCYLRCGRGKPDAASPGGCAGLRSGVGRAPQATGEASGSRHKGVS